MRADLLEQVRDFVAEHPDATLQTVQDAVEARRADVLCALRAVRASQQTDPHMGTEGNRSHPGSRLSNADVHSQEGATMHDEDEELAISAAFQQVGELLQEPVDVLLAILSDVQRSEELKSESERVFKLLGKILAFKENFEAELEETARFLEAFRHIADSGQVPDREVVEAMLAGQYVAPETPAEPAAAPSQPAFEPEPALGEEPPVLMPAPPVPTAPPSEDEIREARERREQRIEQLNRMGG
jgi:hypothetical protein